MKLKNTVLSSIFFLLFVTSTNAQRIKLLSGDFTQLKGQNSFDLIFSYDSMVVGENTPEDQYLEKKKTEWDLKEYDRGSAFVAQWYADREELYEPSFTNFFEEYLKTRTLDRNSSYTLILKTKRTEGGWSAGIIAHPGEIDGELWIVESENPDNIIVKIGFYNVAGKISSGGDFEMTTRIQSAYEEAGMYLGFYLRRKLK